MDHNSPMYREKYLKYKKKYLELKAMEEEMNAGSFLKKAAAAASSAASSAAASASKAADAAKKKAQAMTGTTPQDKFNGQVLAILDKEVKAANEANNKMLAGLESSQQKQILAASNKEFGNSKIFGTGPVATAIKAIAGVVDADGKELRKTTPEAEFKAVMQKLHKSDTVAPVVAKLVSAGIQAVYTEVSKAAGQATAAKYPAGDDAATVKSIKSINAQLVVDKLCKEQGLATGVSTCSEEKVAAVKYAVKELAALEKSAEKANKGLKQSEDARAKAQAAIDEVAKANGAAGAATYATASKAVADKLAANKAELVKAIGVEVSGPVTKESLIKAIGAAAKVTVPAPKSPKTPKTPATPTPEAVAAKK